MTQKAKFDTFDGLYLPQRELQNEYVHFLWKFHTSFFTLGANFVYFGVFAIKNCKEKHQNFEGCKWSFEVQKIGFKITDI